MKMKNTSKKKLCVVRGPRESLVSFYKQFEYLQIQYVAGSFFPLEKSYYYEKNFSYVNLPMYRPFMIDPLSDFTSYKNLNWSFIRGLEDVLRICDVVTISDTYYFSNWQAVMLAKKYRLPVVTVIWTTIPHHITSWFPPYSWITKRVVSSTDLFILRNKTALRFTDSLGIPRDKVEVIYKGVDLDLFHSLERKKDKSLTILFTGNLSVAKGLDDLLFVFQLLRVKYPYIRLVVAGTGSLNTLVSQTSGVEYKGFLHYTQLADLYNTADIYCAPSKITSFLGIRIWEEYFSYALMEAQASGLPIVSTNTGGIPEEVSGNNFLIQPGNRKELYIALETLIVDRSKRIALGLLNRKRAELFFDQKKQARFTELAIEELLHSREVIVH